MERPPRARRIRSAVFGTLLLASSVGQHIDGIKAVLDAIVALPSKLPGGWSTIGAVVGAIGIAWSIWPTALSSAWTFLRGKKPEPPPTEGVTLDTDSGKASREAEKLKADLARTKEQYIRAVAALDVEAMNREAELKATIDALRAQLTPHERIGKTIGALRNHKITLRSGTFDGIWILRKLAKGACEHTKVDSIIRTHYGAAVNPNNQEHIDMREWLTAAFASFVSEHFIAEQGAPDPDSGYWAVRINATGHYVLFWHQLTCEASSASSSA